MALEFNLKGNRRLEHPRYLWTICERM